MSEVAKTQCITGKVRFSYARVFQPQPNESGQDRYSVCVLIPKSATKTLETVKACIDAAFKNGVKETFAGVAPKQWKNPLRDGDEERPGQPEYEGHFFLNASSINKPAVVDINLEPIITADEFYSGCYGRISLNFFAFNQKGNKGVGCGLNNLQKTHDGERLSGGTSAEQDFAAPMDDEDDEL